MRKALIKDKYFEQKDIERAQKEECDQIPDLKREIQFLRNELDEEEVELESREKDAQILESLFRKGIIDGDGNIIEK